LERPERRSGEGTEESQIEEVENLRK